MEEGDEIVQQKKSKNICLVYIIPVAILVAIVAVIIYNSSSTQEVEINKSEDASGIKCIDTNYTGIIFKDYQPTAHTNSIVMAFMGQKLSSITYSYEGEYTNAAEADHARDLAETAYNSTMVEKYGLSVTDFAKNISVKQNNVYASITATDSKNLSSKTAPIFMLDGSQPFPTSLEDAKNVYEKSGFVCEINY